MIVVEKLAKSLIYSDMSLLSKHCSSIYFRCMTAVLDFTLFVTVMLTDLTSGSAPDDESIDIEYCQKIREKVSPMPISILQMKSIADTIGCNTNTAILTTLVSIKSLQSQRQTQRSMHDAVGGGGNGRAGVPPFPRSPPLP